MSAYNATTHADADADVAGAGAAIRSNEQRCCDDKLCPQGLNIAKIPNRNLPEYVVNPMVSNIPVLLGDTTSVFQVIGNSAEFGHIKKAGLTDDKQTPDAIYRIVPNTHLHITNYVIVDDDSALIQRIKDKDPETMKRLIEYQSTSANQRLQKIMGNHGAPPKPITTIKPPAVKTPAECIKRGRGRPRGSRNKITHAGGAGVGGSSINNSSMESLNHSIDLGLSIASVEEGVPFNTTHLSHQQLHATIAAAAASAAAANKMQAELDTLRRTVEELKKNQRTTV